jgi:hypothetical protein
MKKWISFIFVSLVVVTPLTLKIIPCEEDANNPDLCTPPEQE